MSDPIDDLYQQFIEVCQQRGPRPDEDTTAELANEFETITDAHLQVLMNFRAKSSLTEDDSNLCKKLEVMLKEERNTWRLAKALLTDQLLFEPPLVSSDKDVSLNSDQMDDSALTGGHSQNGHSNELDNYVHFSEDQLIGNFYVKNSEIRRMQLVSDWLEANAASDLAYNDEEDKVEYYAEGSNAWAHTFYSIRGKFNNDHPYLEMNEGINTSIEVCPAMDPDAPIRTKKLLAHQDKEIELRLYKHLFGFIRAGKLDEGQELAQRVGYHWLSAMLVGWLPFSDPNLDQENLGPAPIHQPSEIVPVSGNKKKDVWKNTCFKAAKIHGLNSFEKAILGVFGGNLKSVLPVCHTWADQLWCRLKTSIDVKIERALRDPNLIAQENRNLVEFPDEFYDNYQSLERIFESIKDQKIVSNFKEATIHQAVQRFLILNDIKGLLDQLSNWCTNLDFEPNSPGAISPHFLRCFAHVVLFLREVKLVEEEDSRATKIIESYIALLTQQKFIESVAYYSGFLPKDNQTMSFAKLLATISDKETRRQCLRVAKESNLDVDEITQTVVELIRNEPATGTSVSGLNDTKTSAFDRRKIDALDYLLLLDAKNYMATLHHGNILMRYFALKQKVEAVKDTFLKLPVSTAESVKNQWRVHTNSDITVTLKNNLRELEGFRALLEVQEELGQWSEWHHKKPEEPRKPANLAKFCDNVNYEQRLKQYQQDLSVWTGMREVRTETLTEKIRKMFYFPGGWMKDLPTGEELKPSDQERLEQMQRLRRHFVPHMISIQFNVLQLTNRYDDCLKVSHLLAQDDLKLYEEFTKDQLREFLDKISEVTKLIVKRSIAESHEANH